MHSPFAALTQWGHRLGFDLVEQMIGYHEFQAGFGPPGLRPMSFHITWGPQDLLGWLHPGSPDFLSQPLHGQVHIDGLCQGAEIAGQLELRYFSQRELRYVFDFTAQGERYRVQAAKVNIRLWNLPHSHTTCCGTLTRLQDSALVSRSVTFFRWRDLPRFLASFRWRLQTALNDQAA